MALSDLIRKIEDSPGSTKVAVVASGIAVVAVGVALFTVLNQSDSNPEPANPVVRVAAAPTATSVPAPTPRPTPVPTSTPAPTATSRPTATPLPTETPLPTATATPDVSDYFVVLHQSRGDDHGRISFYAEYPFRKHKLEGTNFGFDNEGFYLDYLVKEKVITRKHRDDYFNGNPIQKIPLVSISTATWKLFQNDPYNSGRLNLSAPELLTHYADKSAVGSSSGGGGGISLEGDGGYVSISDGRISVSAVDADGNATTVDLEGVGAQELLNYWLSENKITIEQRNQYGETGQLEFSLKDGVDLFDLDYSSDVEFYTGMDKETQDMIINEILPLLVGD